LRIIVNNYCVTGFDFRIVLVHDSCNILTNPAYFDEYRLTKIKDLRLDVGITKFDSFRDVMTMDSKMIKNNQHERFGKIVFNI